MTDARLAVPGDRPDAQGDYVLYWMQAYRRGTDNGALDHALTRAHALRLPLLVYESLRPDHPHASDRFHTFILQGARDTARELAARGLTHHFFLPRTPEEARGVLRTLAARAALVVTDWAPSFIHPAQTRALALHAPCRVETWDDSCPVPVSLLGRADPGARVLRPRVHRLLPAYLHPLPPAPDPWPLPRGLHLPFTPVDFTTADIPTLVAGCAVDHTVGPVLSVPGGSTAARTRLNAFLQAPLSRYGEASRDFGHAGTSALSPYLHFGQVSARAIALAVHAAGLPADVTAPYLEQLLVRRTLSFVHAHTVPDHARYESLPAWARATLEKHDTDPRTMPCTLEAMDQACTQDSLWNAAQTELRRHGSIHGYMRMVWGKTALQFAPNARTAFQWLVHLNDRYALDGRDPNSYAGIGWCFGLHDHPWPERAVFGSVRCMTTGRAAAKADARAYGQRAYGP